MDDPSAKHLLQPSRGKIIQCSDFEGLFTWGFGWPSHRLACKCSLLHAPPGSSFKLFLPRKPTEVPLVISPPPAATASGELQTLCPLPSDRVALWSFPKGIHVEVVARRG